MRWWLKFHKRVLVWRQKSFAIFEIYYTILANRTISIFFKLFFMQLLFDRINLIRLIKLLDSSFSWVILRFLVFTWLRHILLIYIFFILLIIIRNFLLLYLWFSFWVLMCNPISFKASIELLSLFHHLLGHLMHIIHGEGDLNSLSLAVRDVVRFWLTGFELLFWPIVVILFLSFTWVVIERFATFITSNALTQMIIDLVQVLASLVSFNLFILAYFIDIWSSTII